MQLPSEPLAFLLTSTVCLLNVMEQSMQVKECEWHWKKCFFSAGFLIESPHPSHMNHTIFAGFGRCKGRAAQGKKLRRSAGVPLAA